MHGLIPVLYLPARFPHLLLQPAQPPWIRQKGHPNGKILPVLTPLNSQEAGLYHEHFPEIQILGACPHKPYIPFLLPHCQNEDGLCLSLIHI